MPTDHHLVVCYLRFSKPWLNRDVRKQFASSIAAKFQQLPEVSVDIEMEWLLFRTAMITSAVERCGRKWLKMATDRVKRTPWWNQDAKKAVRTKKDAFKALLQNRSSSDSQSQHSEARKAAAQSVKMSNERSWEEFGRRLHSNYSSAKSTLTDHSPIAWEKFKCHDFHQGFNWKHPPG